MDIKKIKAIVELVKESGIAELEITEGEEKLKISAAFNHVGIQPQQVYHQVAMPAPQSTLVTKPTEAAAIEAAPETKISSDLHYITSPMVGTFYSAPSPTTPAFVTVGQTIKVGQVICIIEAMKLMNQIESEKDGVIKEILVKDGAPIEFGQQLFVIE